MFLLDDSLLSTSKNNQYIYVADFFDVTKYIIEKFYIKLSLGNLIKVNVLKQACFLEQLPLWICLFKSDKIF